MAVRLTGRLRAAVDAVRPGARVVDVGCDHGRLCAWLVQSGQVPFAVAVDINEKPLQKARILFEKCGITDRTAVRQADGLDGIVPGDIDDIVIAGLGADVICGIIERTPWLKDRDKQLVLVPSSRHAQLRVWLCQNGFDIIDEKAVTQGRHCYTVMTVRYIGRIWQPGPVFAAIGILKPGTPDYVDYLDKVYNSAQKVIGGLSGGEKLQAAKQVAGHIERIRGSDG